MSGIILGVAWSEDRYSGGSVSMEGVLSHTAFVSMEMMGVVDSLLDERSSIEGVLFVVLYLIFVSLFR
ncbi:hypothetical protein PDN35_28660 [Bacillus cereus]|nr:hypothetical protein [Bacillus cereus]